MSSREKIVQTITNNKPTLVPLPIIEITNPTLTQEELVNKFTSVLTSIGGQVIEINDLNHVLQYMQQTIAQGHIVVNEVEQLKWKHPQQDEWKDATSLEPIHLAIVQGRIGVAENGAIWIEEEAMGNRLIPFICQHLILILEKDKLVPNMHIAYQTIDAFGAGYGVFLAGPSKTADIEQSLVIGAHGARSLVVYLLDK